MKAFLTTDAIGGVWRYTVELLHALTERGWDTTVLIVGPQPSDRQRLELPSATYVSPNEFPLDWLAPELRTLENAAMHISLLACCDDIALIHAPALLGRWPWKVHTVAMMHSCLTSWFNAVRGGPVPADYAWRAEATATGLLNADAIVAPSRAFAEIVQRTYGLSDVHVIHNGCRPMALPDTTRERAVLTAGRLWDDGKNVAVLDRATAALSAPVRGAGSRTSPDGAVTPLYNIEALGALDAAAMAHAYASHTVFASPARYEPFGLAVLEAAQAGLALVLSDIPTFRELWDGAARFVPSDDPTAWRAALEETLADPAPLALLARERAACYSLAACANRTSDLLHQVIAAN